ncbi:MAG TPA: AMP-binding protein [Burkholderiales bacterium]|nr:AMP-binding protein [Burkholderiales bacterium]
MTQAAVGTVTTETFPKLLLDNARVRGEKVAVREKDLGIWQSWSWKEVADEVRWLACGLAARGLKRGMNIAIIGDNRPRLYWSFAAAQSVGGVPVPLYQDAISQEMQYVLENAEIEVAIVEDQEQVDKLLELLPQCPRLKLIIYDDPRGMRHYTQPQLLPYSELRDVGREYDEAHPEFYLAEVNRGVPDDVSVILYTSGTTSKPKGVCLTHRAFIDASRGDVSFDGFNDTDEVLSYLPMAWVGDYLFSYGQALVAGFTVNCPESSDTVMTDLREIGPTYYFAPPRVFENLLTQVMIRMEDASRLKRWLFDAFMAVAKRCGPDIMDRKPVPLLDRLLYAIGDALIYGPLRNNLGMSRIRVAYTGGAAIGPDLYRFYRSLGINLKQLYGQTETAAYVCKQPNGESRLDTVGKPLPGVEIRIADKGEILVKSPGMLKEYYKSPEATAETITPDGYFKTGDAGFFDNDGHLKIIDRSKDVGKLTDGTMFAPQFLENKLKFFPFIKEAVCFGDGRDTVCAFLNIEMQAVGNWAERNGLPYAGYVDLAGKPEVYSLLQECVDKVNEDLAQEASLSGSQVRRFLILHKELDADDDELTRTRKVRRNFVAEKYEPLVTALFNGAEHCEIETQVKFEDGRSGVISADVTIRDVALVQTTETRKAA